ncbi:MAG TPA: cytochrome c [Alphaproteobacteria bacterium]|nr:cytochrome c [Alphaproteobacteria bacterium]
MRKLTWILPFAGVAALLLVGLMWFTDMRRWMGEGSPTPASPGTPVPSTFTAGEALFNAHCARCHGLSAAGTDQGPSLLWRIYAPSHHSDESFYLAVRQGVRAHHWRFGPMLPIPEVAQDEVTPIIAYVRWLQQQAGVR